MLAVKNQNPILNQHIILKPRDRIGIVSIKGNFEMKHTISRNNAQYFFCTDCALLRNVWGWRQNKMTFAIMPALDFIFGLDKPPDQAYLTNLLKICHLRAKGRR
jgi:hypothetical protein